MSSFEPPSLVPEYRIDAVEFRDHAFVVSFTETDQYGAGATIFDHITREIQPGGDSELDARIVAVHEEICQILDLAHTTKRQPPATRPAGRRPAPNT